MKKYLPYFLIATLLLLIVFDAAQQQYYLTTFDLLPEGASITFFDLLKNHLIRWSIWLLSSIPFFLFLKSYISKNSDYSINSKIISLLFFSLLFALFSVSIHSLLSQDVAITASNFVESFSFFFYQKGLTFLMALIGASLLLANHAKENSLKVHLIEIKQLRKVNDQLRSSKETKVPHLNIKTGYRLKPIPIDEIIWIQSDDYCVKVHTKDNTYTLRQSLKALQQKLEDFRFIRIHRCALLNLEYIDQINFQSSTVKLKNQSEIPLSKTGIRKLKTQMVKS